VLYFLTCPFYSHTGLLAVSCPKESPAFGAARVTTRKPLEQPTARAAAHRRRSVKCWHAKRALPPAMPGGSATAEIGGEAECDVSCEVGDLVY